MTTYNEIATYLIYVFRLLNEEFFEGQLSRPTFTIQTQTKSTSVFPVICDSWITIKSPSHHEICLDSGILTAPISFCVSEILHQLIHIYDAEHGIIDTNDSFHTDMFLAEAQARGLKVSQNSQLGWGITEPGQAVIDFCDKHNLADITMEPTPVVNVRPRLMYRSAPKDGRTRCMCPQCGLSITVSKPHAHVACMRCNLKMVEI